MLLLYKDSIKFYQNQCISAILSILQKNFLGYMGVKNIYCTTGVRLAVMHLAVFLSETNVHGKISGVFSIRWSTELLCPDILTYLKSYSLQVIEAQECRLVLYESR